MRCMPRRWGGCTKADNILLNPDLVQTPLYCSEYGIMYEFCHLCMHDHSAGYYPLFFVLLTDWAKRKMHLDSYVL